MIHAPVTFDTDLAGAWQQFLQLRVTLACISPIDDGLTWILLLSQCELLDHNLSLSFSRPILGAGQWSSSHSRKQRQ